ncbi:MAG: hypothetical protein AB1327_08015 [Bacillota bacterium]
MAHIDRGPAPACPVCGEPVKWSASNYRYNKYCSRRCYGQAARAERSKPERWQEPPKCPSCGKPVAWVNGHWQTYCSVRCLGVARRHDPAKTTYNRPMHLDYRTGVLMSRVLTPAQCAEMRRFLRLCLTAGRKARELGGRVDVMELIRQWREGQWEQPRVADRSAWVELVEQGLSPAP